MIYIDVTFYNKSGGLTREERKFSSCYMALRFMYAMKRHGNLVHGWRTDDPEENEYLWTKWRY